MENIDRQKVLKFLHNCRSENVSTLSIASHLHVHEHKARKFLWELKDQGLVDEVPADREIHHSNKWYITGQGERVYSENSPVYTRADYVFLQHLYLKQFYFEEKIEHIPPNFDCLCAEEYVRWDFGEYHTDQTMCIYLDEFEDDYCLVDYQYLICVRDGNYHNVLDLLDLDDYSEDEKYFDKGILIEGESGNVTLTEKGERLIKLLSFYFGDDDEYEPQEPELKQDELGKFSTKENRSPA